MSPFCYIAVGYRCVARYYESAIGRFTSVDPLAEKYYSWSPYVYVTNNPLKYIDPDGRSGVLTLPIRVARHGHNMYRAAKAFLVGSSAVATGTVYNHYLSQEQAQQAQQNFLNTVTERATEIKAQEAVYEVEAATPEQLAEQARRQRKSNEEDAKTKSKHDKSIDDNISGKQPNGDPSMKRPPNGKIPAIVIGGGMGAAGIEKTVEYVDKALKEQMRKEEEKKKRDKDEEVNK